MHFPFGFPEACFLFRLVAGDIQRQTIKHIERLNYVLECLADGRYSLKNGKEPAFFLGKTEEDRRSIVPLPWESSKGFIPSGVYNRPVYKSLFKAIMDGTKQDCAVQGVPGIGKSLFLVYIMWSFIHCHNEGEWEKVSQLVLMNKSDDTKIGVKCTEDGAEAFEWDGWKNLSETLVLVDGQVTQFHRTILARLTNHGGMYIALVSPRKKNTENLSKPFRELVMPPWTWAEIRTTREILHPDLSEDDAFQTLCIWGGVPRIIFQERNKNVGMLAERAKNVNTSNIALTKDGVSNVDDSDSYKAIHIWTNESFTKMIYTFASVYVQEIVMARFAEQMWKTALENMAAGDTGGAGKVYEKMIHSVIPSVRADDAEGAEFWWHKLTLGAPGWISEEGIGNIRLPICKKMYFVDEYFEQLVKAASRLKSYKGIYAIPMYPNYRTVDSVILPGKKCDSPIFLQITLSLTHSLIMAGYMSVYNNLVTHGYKCETPRFYFVVPEYHTAFVPDMPVYSQNEQAEKELFNKTDFGILFTEKGEFVKSK